MCQSCSGIQEYKVKNIYHNLREMNIKDIKENLNSFI